MIRAIINLISVLGRSTWSGVTWTEILIEGLLALPCISHTHSVKYV